MEKAQKQIIRTVRRALGAVVAVLLSAGAVLILCGVLGDAERAALRDLGGVGGWLFSLVAAAAVVPAARGRYSVFRGITDVALLACGTAAASLLFGGGAGGVAGDALADIAAASLGRPGAALLFVAISLLILHERLGAARKRANVRRPSGVNHVHATSSVIVVEPEPEPESESEFASELEPLASALVPSRAKPIRARPSIIHEFQLPSLGMLPRDAVGDASDAAQLAEEAAVLEDALGAYGVFCKVEDTAVGPSTVTFEGACAPGTKVSKVIGLAPDLGLAFGRKVRVTTGSRPGRIAFEVERRSRSTVRLRDLLEEGRAATATMELPVALGRSTRGAPIITDVAEMPHAIIAGATGSGKSVCLSAMLCSLLLSKGPDELRLLLIDPKVVELQPYSAVPHLLAPVVTDADRAMLALGWAAREMDRRYSVLAAARKKNVAALNRVARPGDRLPHIVIVIDEFADLIAQKGKEAEALVSRLAQKARAAGIHLLLATQRPSVDVITGTIKANFPARIALSVAQRVDSRTILDEQGAEHLCGRGDMLAKLGGGVPERVQCPLVTDAEIEAITGALASQGGPHFDDEMLFERCHQQSREIDGMSAMVRGAEAPS